MSARNGARPLFTEEGEPTAYLESIKAAFRDLKPGMEMTKAFIDTLMRAEAGGTHRHQVGIR